MRKIRFSMCIALALVALAACGKKEAGEDGGEGATQAPADAPSAAPAVTVGGDMGKGLKAGVWEMTTAMPGVGKNVVMSTCMDDAMTKKYTEIGMSNRGKVDCTNQSVNRSGNTVDISAICKDGDRTIHSKIHVEMQGENAYHQTVEATYDPPVAGKSAMTVAIDGKWLGTCESKGMKAGDMEMNGMKMNMSAMGKPAG